jgi:saccharopine dehydrogenase-like NADP-dependent oxidoreductase
LNSKAKENGVLIVTECGLDPGIDHMACMKAVHQIEEEGGELESLETNTGGLIAPESDNNPWYFASAFQFSFAVAYCCLLGTINSLGPLEM